MTDDEEIRALAVRMALENDVHVDRAEKAIRNLISRGLIEANMVVDPTILDLATRGIAERPSHNGLGRPLKLEEKHPRIQTKHRLDAFAAIQALIMAGYKIEKEPGNHG